MPAPPIDRSELKALCELARLHLPADREAEVLGHLRRIVEAFAHLRQVPTDGVEDQGPGGEPTVRLRADEPGPALPRDVALQNAPQQAADMFLVPRVVDA